MMNRHPLFLIYGALVIGMMSFAEFRGVTMSTLNMARSLPRSVRDNPGASRPMYNGSPRYSGGK
jgi:hypothetical protein